jgi:aspartyl-tRNA(Asn)/glutamyl-tRNA(Gln) amidotransferase subunit C
LAKLSKIQLTEDELHQFADELSAILDYAQQLSDVDTSNLEPTVQVTGLQNVTRPDDIIDYGMSSSELLKNAPATKDGLIQVKRVIE